MLPCNKIVGDARARFHIHRSERVVELALDADRLVGVALVDVDFGTGTIQGVYQRRPRMVAPRPSPKLAHRRVHIDVGGAPRREDPRVAAAIRFRQTPAGPREGREQRQAAVLAAVVPAGPGRAGSGDQGAARDALEIGGRDETARARAQGDGHRAAAAGRGGGAPAGDRVARGADEHGAHRPDRDDAPREPRPAAAGGRGCLLYTSPSPRDS